MKTKVVIEFSEKWLKAVVVDFQSAHAWIKDIILEPVEPNLLNVSDAVNKIIAKAGRKKVHDVTVVLSRNKITVRNIDLPSHDPREIEQMLGLHVIRQVPYSKEEIIWGYQNLGFDGVSSSHILLAIAHRDILRKIFNAFAPLKILPERMLFSSPGVIRYIHDSLKDKTILQQASLVLDIDYNYSDLMLIDAQQKLRLSVVISRGAEQLKSEEEKGKFAAELKQALPALRNDLSQASTTQIFLTGAAGNMDNFEAYLGKEINLTTHCIRNKDTDNFGVISKEVSFTAILGFAYQQKEGGICFALPEAQIKKEMRLKIQQLLILGVCLAYIFIMLGLIVFSKFSLRQSYRDKLKTQINQLKAKNDDLTDLVQKVAMVKQYTDTKQSALNYIYELTRVCPDTITLTNFSWERQKSMLIRGYAYRMQDIFSFVNVLENSTMFKGMQARSTRRRKIKDNEVVDFEIGLK